LGPPEIPRSLEFRETDHMLGLQLGVELIRQYGTGTNQSEESGGSDRCQVLEAVRPDDHSVLLG
jgi:hypothetical protein